MSESPKTPEAATPSAIAPDLAATETKQAAPKAKRPARPRKSATPKKETVEQTTAAGEKDAVQPGLTDKKGALPQKDAAESGEKDAVRPAPKTRRSRPIKKNADSSAPAENASVPAAEVNSASAEPQMTPPVEPVTEKPAKKRPVRTTKKYEEITPEIMAEVAPLAQSTQSADQPEGEAKEKSRRSRSRRGRRKSAAARAAAALAVQANAQAGAQTDAQADGNADSSSVDGAENTTNKTSGSQSGPEAANTNRQGSGHGLDTRPSARPNIWQAGQESDADSAALSAEMAEDFAADNADDLTDEHDESGETAGAASRKATGKAAKSDAKETREAARPKSKMFVSVLPGEQVEVVISAEGQVQEYYVEMLHQAKVKGNIYKGVIHNVDANLQAAFVSYGATKNGFLQIDEVHPEYYLAAHEQGKGHKYPLIQKVLKPGQEILVQVVKEPSGTKGAFLTSYLSLPGRFLVLTPGREQIGVSRKVDNEEERARLRDMLSGLNPGEGLGVIVRTVSRGATKTSLQRDLQQLKRLWKDVRKKGSSDPAPCLIYQELGLDTRAVRDYLTEDVSELWVDDEDMAAQLREIVSLLFPRRSDMVHVHKDVDTSLFERFSLKKQLEQVHSREVTLPSGGRLVFDHTEALMAIDINSGRAAGKNNFEDTAYKTNLEAAQMIPLQLRLRDIGGQVVIDFIEMRDRSHWREVEKAMRNGMKIDRARHDIGKISSFGLLEIVRQRLSSSAISVTTEPCPCCKGTGQRRNLEWQAQQALREIRSLLRKNNETNSTVVYSNNAELVLYLLNSKRERLLELEHAAAVKLELRIV